MPQFKYVGEKFFAEKVSIEKITSKNKTPFYLYSENQIKENFLNFKRSFKQVNPIICFAAKANSNLSILRLLGKLGAGADVVSGGELLKAIKRRFQYRLFNRTAGLKDVTDLEKLLPNLLTKEQKEEMPDIYGRFSKTGAGMDIYGRGRYRDIDYSRTIPHHKILEMCDVF